MVTLISRNSALRRYASFMAVCTLSLLFASCDATIHFYPEAEERNGDIRLDVDWSGYGKDVPTGMTVLCYHSVTGEHVRKIDNNTSYVTPSLSSGRHWAAVFNLTEDEYNYVRFSGLEAVETAEAYTRQREVPDWYPEGKSNDSYIAGEPEWLAVDTIMTDHVEKKKLSPGITTIGTLHPKNIIYTLHITIRTENIGNLVSARGAITGLASRRRLAADRPNDNTITVTQLILTENWTRSRNSKNSNEGFVRADIRCFGLPGNHQATPEENTLLFHAMLADGKTVLEYTIPVGHLILEKERPPKQRGDNLDLYLDVKLDPPIPPFPSGENVDSSWNVGLDNWGIPEDVTIYF